jgi:hypothetical protein
VGISGYLNSLPCYSVGIEWISKGQEHMNSPNSELSNDTQIFLIGQELKEIESNEYCLPLSK